LGGGRLRSRVYIRGGGHGSGQGKLLGKVGEEGGSGQGIWVVVGRGCGQGSGNGKGQREGDRDMGGGHRRLRAELVQRFGKTARVQVALGHRRLFKVEAKQYTYLFYQEVTIFYF